MTGFSDKYLSNANIKFQPGKNTNMAPSKLSPLMYLMRACKKQNKNNNHTSNSPTTISNVLQTPKTNILTWSYSYEQNNNLYNLFKLI